MAFLIVLASQNCSFQKILIKKSLQLSYFFMIAIITKGGVYGIF
jgi:hypothetical protein